MEQKDLERLIREKEGVASAAFPALMRKVYVWMDGWIGGWVGGWMDGWMDGWMERWMNR